LSGEGQKFLKRKKKGLRGGGGGCSKLSTRLGGGGGVVSPRISAESEQGKWGGVLQGTSTWLGKKGTGSGRGTTDISGREFSRNAKCIETKKRRMD